jgi:HSP20 family protein
MSEKNKKSFFSKLLGNKNNQTENKKLESNKDNSVKNIRNKTNQDQEEWAADYEGQLTIDVYQTDEDIIIKSTIAGVTPEDIDITIDNDMVIIKGERKNCTKAKEEDYYYQECYWGSFSRSVILPCDIEADKIQAELKNGILTVTLPKAHKSKTKKISVKTEE